MVKPNEQSGERPEKKVEMKIRSDELSAQR